MKFLHRDIADIAVSKLRELVPFELAMMDDHGMILSSTRAELVGSISPAAQQCLVGCTNIRVSSQSTMDVGGFYSVLCLEEVPIGAIAVYGEVSETEPYVNLTCTTAELLVLQAQSLRKKQMKGQSINDFMHEWLFQVKEYTTSFLNRGKALGIHVDKPYFLVLFQHDCPDIDELLPLIRANCLQPLDLWVKVNSRILAVATCDSEHYHNMIHEMQLLFSSAVGIGNVTDIIYKSLTQALEALRFGPVFAPNTSIYHYRDFSFIHQLSNIGTPEMLQEMETLEAEGRGVDMIGTLLTFVECSGEITPTAQALFIHRNTLKYRLDKIFEITKRDPQNLEDLFYLYTAVVHYLLVKRGLDAPQYTMTVI